MLGEEILDLGDACPSPILEPGLCKVVLDAMEAAFAHVEMIDRMADLSHGPFGSIGGPGGPGNGLAKTRDAALSPDKSTVRGRAAEPRGSRRGGARPGRRSPCAPRR